MERVGVVYENAELAQSSGQTSPSRQFVWKHCDPPLPVVAVQCPLLWYQWLEPRLEGAAASAAVEVL